MSIFNTSRYLKAIFWALPMGILSIYYGGRALRNVKQDVNDYPNTYGIVDSIYDARIKINISSVDYYNALMVRIENDDFYAMSGKNKRLILSNLLMNDTVSIWYLMREDGGEKEIKAIKRGEEYIIKYEPGGYWVGILFMLWGLFWLVISVLYVVKHPEDLFGSKKSKEKK